MGMKRATRVKAGFVVFIFLLTLVFPLLTIKDSVQDAPSTLSQSLKMPHVKQKPDWNKEKYNWKQIAGNKSYVDVILSLDTKDLNKLDKNLQKKLEKSKDHTYRFAISGFNAMLDVEDIELILYENPQIQIMPDYEVHAFVSVNQTGADAMWNRSLPSGNMTKGDGITVAIIDTGIYYNHVALGGGFGPTKRVIGGWDFVNNDSNPVDDMGHGTHCAGIVGANGTVLFGIAPEVKFYAVKVLNSAGSGSMSDVAAGIEWAMDPNGDSDTSDHADVLSLSLGSSEGSPYDVASLAVDAAVAAGAVVCVAAGNDGPTFGTVASPGVAHDAITVGSVDSTGTISSFSSRGTTPYTYLKPEVMAPGYNIYSTYFTGGYKSMSGTSMSTPHVAGAAALLIQTHPTWTPSQVKSALITGCHQLNNSVWNTGAGQIWVPWSSDAKAFSVQEMVSYGIEYGTYCNISINSSIAANYTVSTMDFHSVLGNYTLNGSMVWHTDTNLSAINESYLDLGAGSIGYLHLNIPLPPDWVSEGYFEGRVNLSNTLGNLSIPFGFALVSELVIVSLDLMGNEIYDLTGYCWALELADPANVRNSYYACAVFHVTSGNYSVNSMGHLLVYTYTTPFVLGKDVHVSRLSNQTVYLQLNTAKKFTMDLSNQVDHPMYVSDFRMYWRWTEGLNLSIDRDITDYSVEGSGIFSIQKFQDIYVSTTNASLGFAIMGYGFSDAIWDFMEMNYDHWIDYVSEVAPFYFQSIADEIYLLSWEFRGINDTVSEPLSINWTASNSYQVKYDIMGNVSSPWCQWGYNRQLSGMAAKWERRDTDASVFPFFPSNVTLTVQGPHLESYFSQTMNYGHPYRDFYVPDWNHTVDTAVNGVDAPIREYVQSIVEDNRTLTTGEGPLYVSARMENTNSSLVLYHPLYRMTNGDRWSPISYPNLYLYRGASLSGVYQLSESNYITSGARRNISTSLSGIYYARMTTYPANVMCTNAEITLRWQIPGTDRSPPYIESFDMPQRFVQGGYVNISFQARDSATTSLTAFWRNGSADSWHSLTPVEDLPGLYNLSITTSATTATVDLRLNISDTTGNYINYTLTNCSRFELPVTFDLTVSGGIPDIVYSNSEASVLLWGNLTVGGAPVNNTGAVLLELYSEGKKVGVVMDEYIDGTSHSHNGTIRFVWNFDPTQIFTGPGESKNITCKFDLGTYQVRWANFTMNTTTATDLAPIIELAGPSNNSIIECGTQIDLDVSDEYLTGMSASIDGYGAWNLTYPKWNVDTSNWTDGDHILSILASDLNTTSTASYTFSIDSLAPVISITSPSNGSSILDSATITATVADNSTTDSWWTVNGVGYQDSTSPYSKPSPWLSLVGWPNGWYNVSLTVYDVFGQSAYDEVNFNITSESPTITNYPVLSGVVGYEYSYNSTSTGPDSGVNTWGLTTNATWLNLNFTDSTHGFVNGTPAIVGSYWANISVSDGDSGDYINWTIEIAGAPPPPSFTTFPDIGVREDHTFDYVPAMNQTIDTWSWTTNASSFLSFNSATGEVTGTADNSLSNRIYWFNITASNVNGTVYQNWSFTVWNLAPAFTPDLGTPPTIGIVGRAISYDANHSDEGVGVPPGDYDGVTTNFTGYYSFNVATGHLNFTPTYAGELWWNVTANDQRGIDNSTSNLNWTMDISEKAPYILSSPVASTTVWELFSFNCSATPPDLGTTTWNHTTNATWLSFIWGNQTKYNVSGTPVVLGSYWLNFSVNDSDSNHYLNFTLSVVAGPTPVFTSSPPLIAYEDNLYFYQAVCDDHIDTWSLLFNNATWATWNPVNGSFMGTPLNNVTRQYFSLYISATNINGTEWQNWWVVVDNRQPVFSTSPIIAVVNNTAYSYNSTTDDEGYNATYTVNSNATFAYNINPISGEVTFTPDVVCIIWVNITCDDGSMYPNATWYQNFTVMISASSPLIQNLPAISIVAWVIYWYNSTCTVPDSGPTVWVFWTDAPWLSIVSGGSGFNVCNISGLPTILGVFWANLSVSDGDSTSYINWSINVLAGPHPNIMSTPSLGVTEDFLYFYLPTADQPDVTWVLVWIDGTWLVFDPANGSLMGTPDNSESELGFNIWLRAENMNGTDTHMWQVFVYNNPPVFNTTPADLNETIGGTFTYDPTTTDESVGATAYTVSTNTTDWYTIDATTGQLVFTPTIGGSWWFDIVFDDFSAVANSTAHQNITITVPAASIIPPIIIPPGSYDPISVSFKFVIDQATVFFSDNSYGDAYLYIWDFGDGKGSTSRNPTHIYGIPGIYNVTLTVVGLDNKSYKLTTRIDVRGLPPVSTDKSGFNIMLTDEMMLKVSAIGLLVFGCVLFASAVYLPGSSILMTTKGRKVIGALMVAAGIYFYVFIDGSWWG